MPRLLQTLCLVFITAFASHAVAADLGKLQQSFMARYDEANTKRDEGLKKLEASYLAALKRHLDKVKNSGRLEIVIPVRDEIEAVETAVDPLPKLPEKSDRELKDLRQKYVGAREAILETHAKTLVELAEKMEQALEKAEASLTKAGRIDEALAAKRMRETLGEDAGIQGARERGASPSILEGEWECLSKLQAVIIEKGESSVGWVEGDPQAKITDNSMAQIKKFAPKSAVFISVPNARVEFRSAREIREFRCKLVMGMNGDAQFRVYANGKLKKRVDLAGEGQDREISVEFEPTKTLVLEVDNNGNTNMDCALWVNPMVR